MMLTTPHTHYCPKCRRHTICEATDTGGCVFQPTSDMGCRHCKEQEYPLAGEVYRCPRGTIRMATALDGTRDLVIEDRAGRTVTRRDREQAIRRYIRRVGGEG